jgi:predicted  nucleic acid-binding Zn-ribbon protein
MGGHRCIQCGQVFDQGPPPGFCPQCGGSAFAVASHDILPVQLQEHGLAHGKGSGTETIAHGTASESSRTEQAADGTITFEAHGKSPQGEEGAEKVCQILLQRLNQAGANWSNLLRSTEPGIDFEARDGSLVLKLQVTRVPSDSAVWASLGRSGTATGRFAAAEQAADALRSPIQQKSLKSPTGVTLALDATLIAVHVLQSVIESFRQKHGSWASTLGFHAVWLVGPGPTFTFRLDE